MEFNIIQIIAFLLGLFFLYKTWKLVKKKEESLFYFFLWSIIGVLLIILSFDLQIIDNFLSFMNMTSRVNLLFSGTALFLLFLVFTLFEKLGKLEIKISKLNEQLSIIKYYQKKKRKK